MNRYSMPMLRPNGDGLTVRWKCANSHPGDARQQGGEDERRHLDAEGVDAHRLGHRRAALDRAQGAAGARVEQVRDRHRGQDDDDPEQVEEAAPGAERDAEERQRRDAEQAVVLAEEVEVAEQVEQAQAPGDRRQRQVVARHAQRHPREDERGERGDGQADPDREPGRDAVGEGQVRRGVRAHADERRLAEGGQAGDPGEQHQADHDQRVEADVVRLRDQELVARRRQHRHQRQRDDEDASAMRRRFTPRLRRRAAPRRRPPPGGSDCKERWGTIIPPRRRGRAGTSARAARE